MNVQGTTTANLTTQTTSPPPPSLTAQEVADLGTVLEAMAGYYAFDGDGSDRTFSIWSHELQDFIDYAGDPGTILHDGFDQEGLRTFLNAVTPDGQILVKDNIGHNPTLRAIQFPEVFSNVADIFQKFEDLAFNYPVDELGTTGFDILKTLGDNTSSSLFKLQDDLIDSGVLNLSGSDGLEFSDLEATVLGNATVTTFFAEVFHLLGKTNTTTYPPGIFPDPDFTNGITINELIDYNRSTFAPGVGEVSQSVRDFTSDLAFNFAEVAGEDGLIDGNEFLVAMGDHLSATAGNFNLNIADGVNASEFQTMITLAQTANLDDLNVLINLSEAFETLDNNLVDGNLTGTEFFTAEVDQIIENSTLFIPS